MAALTSVLQLFTCSMVGYGLARFKFPGSQIIFGLAIFTLMIPPQLIMTPSYLNFRFFDFFGLLKGQPLNLTGTYWPFILMSLTGTGFRCGLYIFIMRQFFRGYAQGTGGGRLYRRRRPLHHFLAGNDPRCRTRPGHHFPVLPSSGSGTITCM